MQTIVHENSSAEEPGFTQENIQSNPIAIQTELDMLIEFHKNYANTGRADAFLNDLANLETKTGVTGFLISLDRELRKKLDGNIHSYEFRGLNYDRDISAYRFVGDMLFLYRSFLWHEQTVPVETINPSYTTIAKMAANLSKLLETNFTTNPFAHLLYNQKEKSKIDALIEALNAFNELSPPNKTTEKSGVRDKALGGYLYKSLVRNDGTIHTRRFAAFAAYSCIQNFGFVDVGFLHKVLEPKATLYESDCNPLLTWYQRKTRMNTKMRTVRDEQVERIHSDTLDDFLEKIIDAVQKTFDEGLDFSGSVRQLLKKKSEAEAKARAEAKDKKR